MKTALEILERKDKRMLSVKPDTLIYDALTFMVDKNIGAVLVKDGDKIVGIWTERDLMKNTVQDGFDPKAAKISEYMTKKLRSVPCTATVYTLHDIFLGKRLRHLLIERDGQYIGLLSAGDVMKAILQAKDQELHELNVSVSWEYYEDWKWKKKKS